jgi:hypothetical protein
MYCLRPRIRIASGDNFWQLNPFSEEKMKKMLLTLSSMLLMASTVQAADLVAHQSKISQQLELAARAACNPSLIQTVQKVLSQSINDVCKLNGDRENRGLKCSAQILNAVRKAHPTMFRELRAAVGSDAIVPTAEVHAGSLSMMSYMKKQFVDPGAEDDSLGTASNLQVSIHFGKAPYQKLDMTFLAAEEPGAKQDEDESEISDTSEVRPFQVRAIDDIRIGAVPTCSLEGKNQLAQVMMEICDFQSEITKSYNQFRREYKPFREKADELEASLRSGKKYSDVQSEILKNREDGDHVSLKMNLLGNTLKERYPLLFGRESYYVDGFDTKTPFHEAALDFSHSFVTSARLQYQGNWVAGADDLTYTIIVDATGERAIRSVGVYYDAEMPRIDRNPRFYDQHSEREYDTDHYESRRLCFGK